MSLLESIQDDPLLMVLSALLGLFILLLFVTWPHHIPSSLPGPGRTYPYIGALPAVLGNIPRFPDYVNEQTILAKGKTWGFPMPKFGMLKGSVFVVTTNETVKYVLKDNFENYVKGKDFQDVLEEFLGEGIFASDGPVWKFHRKVASRMFTNRLLRESTLIAKKHALRMVDHFNNKCKQDGGATVVDIQDMFFRLTMDIFTFIAFGEDLESVTRKDPHEFATAFDTVQQFSEKRFLNPLWKVFRFFQLSHGEREIVRSTAIIDAFAKKVITGKRRVLGELDLSSSRNAGSDEETCRLGPDLLSRFLEDAAKKEEDEKKGITNEARTSGSDKELRDIVLNFMIAGRDTTACALSWTMYELLKAPDILEKVRAEYDSVFKSPEDIRYDDVNKMNFTHAVVMEALRLHPSVPKDVKCAVKADTLPDGVRIPAGAAVLYCPYALGREESIWPEPNKFKPERFLNKETGVNCEPNMYTYTVFNAGPRLCLGKPLALMEVKLITGMLLANFNVEMATNHDGGYGSTIVLPMSPGLKIKLSPRK